MFAEVLRKFRLFNRTDKADVAPAILIISILLTAGCRTNNKSSAEAAIQASASVAASSGEQVLSLHEAALNGLLSLVSKNLDTGTDVDSLDQDGRTALMYAAYSGHEGVIKGLLEAGADVNLQDANGRTALMMAASGPFPGAVKLLLDHNADPNVADREEHFTALMYAAAEGHLENVRILLAHRADNSLKDVDGDDAMTFARNNGHNEIVRLLQSLK